MKIIDGEKCDMNASHRFEAYGDDDRYIGSADTLDDVGEYEENCESGFYVVDTEPDTTLRGV